MIRRMLKWALPRCGDKLFNLVNYRYLYGKLELTVPSIEWQDPVRFNHKLMWLKMRYRHPNASMYADKILVKGFVSEVVGDEVVIPTLGVWRNADDIEFDRLPESFILKTNHGSGWNISVTKKHQVDILDVRRQLNKWLQINYFKIGREYQYRNIAPRILAEPLLKTVDGHPLMDYKLFCFQGEPKFIQVDFDRQTHHTRNFYDLEWQKMPFNILYPPHIGDPKKPANLDKMIAIARRLAQGFPFIRVDLYDVDGHVYFGELTFHPEGGFGPITPDEWDMKLGAMLVLPPIASNVHDNRH